MLFRSDNENADIVNFILNEKLYVNPQDLSKSVISLIKLHPKIIKVIKDLQDNKLEENLLKLIKDLNSVSILKSYLELSCVSDLLLEELFIEIRKFIVKIQQDIIITLEKKFNGIILEGRDCGSVVAPKANLKLYLVASLKVRAEIGRAHV